MRARTSTFLAKVILTCALAAAPAIEDLVSAQGRGRGQTEPRGRPTTQVSQSRDREPSATRQGPGRPVPRGYEEPALARGYDDGYERGLADGRRGQRYDPADSREYRSGDQGYVESYGVRDAYRNNYRAGFRQGYEEGYRNATR